MNWSPIIQGIVIDYQKHLELNYDKNYQKKFDDLLTKDNEEAAISEAIVFNWLCQSEVNPKVKEDKSTGGTDFVCSYSPQYQFIVEVTCFGKKALTKATGCHELPVTNLAYKLPTSQLRTKIGSKADQVSPYKMPSILIITSLHQNANLLLGRDAATNCLVSDWVLSISLDKSINENYLSTELKDSIFFRINKQNKAILEPCRQSISAVLLIAISGDRINVCGILHQEPNYEFDIGIFPKVPFIKINSIQDGKIFTEWIIAEPYLATYSLETSIKI